MELYVTTYRLVPPLFGKYGLFWVSGSLALNFFYHLYHVRKQCLNKVNVEIVIQILEETRNSKNQRPNLNTLNSAFLQKRQGS